MMLGTQLTIEDCDIQDLNLTIHTDICSYPSILSIPSLFHYQIPVPQGLFIDPYCNNETYLISRKNISQKIISLPNEDVSNALINLVGLSTTYLEIDNTNIYNFSLHVNGSDIYLSAEKRIDYEEHDKRDISQLSFIFMIISVCICSITIIVLLVFIFMKIKKLLVMTFLSLIATAGVKAQQPYGGCWHPEDIRNWSPEPIRTPSSTDRWFLWLRDSKNRSS